MVLEILSHDLAGAFIMQQQLTDYVREELDDPTNPRVPEMLTLMRDTSQKSVAMIHDLVDQEFLESTSIPLRRERVGLGKEVAGRWKQVTVRKASVQPLGVLLAILDLRQAGDARQLICFK